MDIIKFLEDRYELEAFITGPAGSGKTTKLKEIVEQLSKTKYTYQLVAYTHKAKEQIISKLPEGTPCSTLHSFLKKRPGINEKAKHIRTLLTTHQHGSPEQLDLLIVDEYSFISEDDYMSIGDLQDELELPEGTKPLKVLYVGDLNQLEAIGLSANIRAKKPYWLKLTEIFRTSNTLTIALAQLVDMLEGKLKPGYIEGTEHFIRKANIIEEYKKCKDSKLILSFTNKNVQKVNATIQGRSEPKKGDMLFVPSTRYTGKLVKVSSSAIAITTPSGRTIDEFTKYNPLKYLHELSYVDFYYFDDGKIVAGIFGSYTNKIKREELGNKLVSLNKQNKDSKKAYREYKTINDCTCIIDFVHCTTVHKAQGSECEEVFVDGEDFKLCQNIQTRLRLLYVAISRAKNRCFINN